MLVDRDMCSLFPGCLLCLPKSGEMRVLSTTSQSDNVFWEYYYGLSEGSGGDADSALNSLENQSRKLFSTIVPIYHDEINNLLIAEEGFCGTGFTGYMACESGSVTSSASLCEPLYYFFFIFIQVLCAAMIV